MVGQEKAETTILTCYLSAFNNIVFTWSGSHRVYLDPVGLQTWVLLSCGLPFKLDVSSRDCLVLLESSWDYFYNLHGSTTPGIS